MKAVFRYCINQCQFVRLRSICIIRSDPIPLFIQYILMLKSLRCGGSVDLTCPTKALKPSVFLDSPERIIHVPVATYPGCVGAPLGVQVWPPPWGPRTCPDWGLPLSPPRAQTWAMWACLLAPPPVSLYRCCGRVLITNMNIMFWNT